MRLTVPLDGPGPGLTGGGKLCGREGPGIEVRGGSSGGRTLGGQPTLKVFIPGENPLRSGKTEIRNICFRIAVGGGNLNLKIL